MKKLTDKQIAEYYGLTQNTISNYRNATDKKRLVYEALRFSLEYKIRKEDAKNILNCSTECLIDELGDIE